MCGIVGVSGNKHVVQDLYDGLVTLQHRGQDASGIMTYDGNKFHLHKGQGLVREVFNQHNTVKLVGNMGLGHVRYPTAGGATDPAESQPFYVNSPFGIALVHNGNLTNYINLSKEVKETNRRHLETKSDSEVLLNVVADELLKLNTPELTPELLFKAMRGVYKRVTGAYSVIMMIAGHGLVAFRDPQGHRPLVLGRRMNGVSYEYMVASESVALSTMGFEVLRDVKPSEVVFIDSKQDLHAQVLAEQNQAPCIFEWVYLARPDSTIDDVSVYKARLRMGRYLGRRIKEENLDIDVVIPVPDSSRSSAIDLAHELGVKYREGLVKNRYIGRTFIMPGQAVRNKSIRYKLNPIELELSGKNVLLVDDSIVRGNTSKQIIKMVRGAGANKVYMASCAPPLTSPCVYGVDIPTKRELIGSQMSIEEIREAIGADGLYYQTIEDLWKSIKKGNPKLDKACMACFTGEYPTPEVTPELLKQADYLRSCERMEDLDDMEAGKMAKTADEDQMSIME